MNAHSRPGSLLDRCTGKWPSILGALGVPEKVLSRRNVPCPMCGGRDRFRFTDVSGDGDWICSRCGHGTGFMLVQKLNGWSAKDALRAIEPLVGAAVTASRRPDRSPEEQRAAMRSLWKSSQRLADGDFVSAYLRHRGIPVCPSTGLRTAFKCYCADSDPRFRPAMLALVTDAKGAAVNLHRTYLTEDGRKAPVEPVRRLMPGPMPAGVAVRLAEPGPVMGIAEGIETALSASRLFGLPVWAALTANRLAVWVPPPEAREVVVFGDNDASYTGQEAAFHLAKTLTTGGLSVRVEVPSKVGTDWNDVLMNNGDL